MQLELPKRLNSILPILKWNLTFYFRELIPFYAFPFVASNEF